MSPEYYADMLKIASRSTDLPFDERSCRDMPGLQGVDNLLSQRLQAVLEVLADISLHEKGNVSVTTASLKDNSGTLETKLYIVFNHDLRDKKEDHRNHLD